MFFRRRGNDRQPTEERQTTTRAPDPIIRSWAPERLAWTPTKVGTKKTSSARWMKAPLSGLGGGKARKMK
jgi:hypothetical protein